MGQQLGEQPFLGGLKHFHGAAAQAQQVFHRVRHFLEGVEQLREIFSAVQLLFVKGRARFHQQAGDFVLHAHRLAHHQIAIAQQAAQFADLWCGHVAGGQQMAAHQVGDFAGIDGVVLFLAGGNRLQHERMRHLQARGIGFQSVVNPCAEQRRFHGPVPGRNLLRGPVPQSCPLRQQFALFDHRAIGGLDAEVDVFLVDVESDIVRDVHWVLLV